MNAPRKSPVAVSRFLCAVAAVLCVMPSGLAADSSETGMSASAAEDSPGPTHLRSVPAPEPPALDTGDNAWMLTSSALVLMMTGPGLALFYSGLVRKKNVLGVMMQCIFLMCLMTVIWGLWGYTMSFGGDTASPTAPKWIGNADHLFMRGVEATMIDGKAVIPQHPALTINR